MSRRCSEDEREWELGAVTGSDLADREQKRARDLGDEIDSGSHVEAS